MEMTRCLDNIQNMKSQSSVLTSDTQQEQSFQKTLPLINNMNINHPLHCVPAEMLNPKLLANQFNYEQHHSFNPYMLPQPQQDMIQARENENAYLNFMNSCRPSGLIVSKPPPPSHISGGFDFSSYNNNGINVNRINMHNMSSSGSLHFMNNSMVGMGQSNSLTCNLFPGPTSSSGLPSSSLNRSSMNTNAIMNMNPDVNVSESPNHMKRKLDSFY